MNTTIDRFTKQLSNSLEEVEKWAESLKNNQSITTRRQMLIDEICLNSITGWVFCTQIRSNRSKR